MSNYQPKPSSYHLTHPANKVSWSNSSINCNPYMDSASGKTNSVRNNIIHTPIGSQYQHSYNEYTRNGSYNNQQGMYMPTSGYCYNYPKSEDAASSKNFVPNDKRHHEYDAYETIHGSSKKPRIEIDSSGERLDESNNCEAKNSIAPQVASAISSHKNKSKSYLLSSGFKDYIRQQNDRVSRNASETYFNNSSSNPELFINQEPDLPISPAVDSIFSNVESSINEREESNCDNAGQNLNTKASELRNMNTAIDINDDSSDSNTVNEKVNGTTAANGTDEHINSTSCSLSEFFDSNFSKEITSEDFMVGTKDMYKNFIIQFQPIVNDLVDKAKSTKKEDRDSLAMDMWQLGCLENTIRGKVEKISIAEEKMFSLLKSMERRKLILNSIEKAIQESKSKIYKAARK